MINYSSGKANIINGNLINGTIDKSIINDKIVYYTWDRHGHEITRNFLTMHTDYVLIGFN